LFHFKYIINNAIRPDLRQRYNGVGGTHGISLIGGGATGLPTPVHQQPHPSQLSARSHSLLSTASSSSSSSSSAAAASPGGGRKRKGGPGSTGGGSVPGSAGRPAKRRAAAADEAGDKSKGLRHFSLKVCEKLEAKGRTTYNEVADELVRELTAASGKTENNSEKNARRRVYDSLNVLMALNIIAREKKEIRWIGFPSRTRFGDGTAARKEITAIKERIARKHLLIQELLMQLIAFKHLLAHNARGVAERAAAGAAGGGAVDPGAKLFLPFILINTKPETKIECVMDEPRSEVFFTFSQPFEIHDDNEVLRKMNLYETTIAEMESIMPAEIVKQLPLHHVIAAGVMDVHFHHAQRELASQASEAAGKE
jgi:hypothetical protein